jgi:hypothetical protein
MKTSEGKKTFQAELKRWLELLCGPGDCPAPTRRIATSKVGQRTQQDNKIPLEFPLV